MLLIAFLAACAPVYLLDDEVTRLATVDVLLTDVDPAAGLISAEFDVRGALLDHCGDLLVFPEVATLDLLGPSEEPLEILPGGYCTLHLLPPNDRPGLHLSGIRDGEPYEIDLAIGSISVLEPFLIGADAILLVVPFPFLESGIDPLLAEVWVDVDEDGFLGPEDELPR